MTWGQQTETLYNTSGFGAPSRRGVRPAIIVVDLTRGFTEPHFAPGADLTDAVLSTEALCKAARIAGIPIIFTKIAYTAAEAKGTSIAWLSKATGMRSLQVGSEAVDFDPRLTVTEDDQLIVKKGASAFFGSHLAALLTSLDRDTVIVCGASTSGCVRASAVDAVQSGFGVLVPRQCVGDRASGPHDANLFDINAKYGDVIDLAEALAYVGSVSAGATAREVSGE
jgi:nicotinamidase-related amidase